jgi:DNA polymerase/3'-5' exonuclease PolX
MPIRSPSNEDIAHLLEQIADLLEQQDDNPYRVQAFRRGAESVRTSAVPLTEIVRTEGGPLAGKRVIRGREGECEQFYLSQAEKGNS